MLEFYLSRGIVRFNDKYLVLRKKEDVMPENIGKWELPGGKINQGESPENAALREVLEETGLDCKIVRELPLLQKTNEKVKSVCHIFLLQAPYDKIKLSEDHFEYKWIKPSEFKSLDLVLFADLIIPYFKNPKKYLK